LNHFRQTWKNRGETRSKLISLKLVAIQVAQFGCDFDSVASLKTRSLEDLQRAWKSIRRMESLSDDPAEAKGAKRALAFVDKAFAKLEGG
jgi:hypothetical protein